MRGTVTPEAREARPMQTPVDARTPGGSSPQDGQGRLAASKAKSRGLGLEGPVCMSRSILQGETASCYTTVRLKKGVL